MLDDELTILFIISFIAIHEIPHIIFLRCYLEASMMPSKVVTQFGRAVSSYGSDDLPLVAVVHRAPVGP
mgnify:CR=1 FL=1